MDNESKKMPIGATTLPESMLQKAKDELRENEENIEEGLKGMQQIIEESELDCRKDKDFLLRFLRVKKFNVEESFASLTHYTQHFSSLKSCLGMPEADLIKNALDKKLCILLPYRDSQGRAIIVYKAGVWIEEEIEVEDALKALIAVCYYLLEDPATQVGGILLIMDVEKFSFSETPYAVEYCRVLISMIRFYPARFQRIDVINEHMVFSTFMSIIKPFLPTKIGQRITFHGKNRESLLEYYDPWMLPQEYGGTLEVFDNSHYIKEMDRVIESLREDIRTYDVDD